jgi:hypothetical protein
MAPAAGAGAQGEIVISFYSVAITTRPRPVGSFVGQSVAGMPSHETGSHRRQGSGLAKRAAPNLQY